MFTRTEKRGDNNEEDLAIFTMEEGASEHSPGAVNHKVGGEVVNILSNDPSWGACPVHGRDNLRLLRDAFIAICKEEGIE